MMATTSLLQGGQHQLDDKASLTTAETPSQHRQQLQLQQRQRCLCINSNNTIATRETTLLQWWQGCLHIDDNNGAIAIRAMTPA
jgi:hypothetical protein